MADVIIIGGGGHARVLLDVLRRLAFRIVGFAAPEPAGARIDVPYLGRDEELAQRVAAPGVIAVLGLGKTGVDDRRMRVMAMLAQAGYSFPAIVAPTAAVHAGVELGDGSVVLDGAIVATGSRLGRGCIVNTHATVDHDCRFGDDVHVAPGATVCGDVDVGSGCMIGAGATLVHAIRVCPGALIGAGATVVRDITERGNYVGTPARRSACP